MYSGSVVFQTWQHHAKHQEYRCKCKAVHISLHQMSSVFRLSNWALNSAADALVAAWGAWNTKIDSTKLRKGKKLKSSVQRRNALSGGMLPVLSWEEHRAWDAVKSSYKFGFGRNSKLTINALLSKSCISHLWSLLLVIWKLGFSSWNEELWKFHTFKALLEDLTSTLRPFSANRCRSP